MKILVVSDTHNIDNVLFELLEKITDIDMFIHCGDSGDLSDYIDQFVHCDIEMVAGNCDFCSMLPREKVVDVQGHKLFITHGDAYGVKGSRARLAARAKELGAEVAIYGHTHVTELAQVDGITVFNPGSLSLSRDFRKKYTFGIIDIDKSGEMHYTISCLS